MKFCIINLTRTPIRRGVNSNATEMINICNDFNQAGHDCTIINNIKVKSSDEVVDLWSAPTSSDESSNDLGFKSINYTDCDPNDFDAIMIMNSHPNFFGGEKDEIAINKFKWLSKSKKPIYYLFNDRNLPYRELWPQIKGKKWNDCVEEDVKITAPVYVISQFSDINDVISINNKDNVVHGGTFVDFGVWLLNDYENKYVKNQGKYDLIYGGSFRGGRREPKFRDFFFNKDLDVAIYGTMKLDNYEDKTNPPKNWLGKVDSSKVIEENSLGFATIIVGEKGYNNHINIIRQYESILAGCITFVDNDFDVNHTIYDNAYLYIRSGEELENKIKELKVNKNLYESCIISQNNFLKEKSKINYIDQIINYIKETKNE